MHVFLLSLQSFPSSYLLLSAALAIAFLYAFLSHSFHPSLHPPIPEKKKKRKNRPQFLCPFTISSLPHILIPPLLRYYHHIHALSSHVLSWSFLLFIPCFSFFVLLSTQPSRCYRNRSIWNRREWKLFLGNFPRSPFFALRRYRVPLCFTLSSSILTSLIHVNHCRDCCCHGHCRNLDTINTQRGHGNLKGQHGKTKRPRQMDRDIKY